MRQREGGREGGSLRLRISTARELIKAEINGALAVSAAVTLLLLRRFKKKKKKREEENTIFFSRDLPVRRHHSQTKRRVRNIKNNNI